MRLLVALLAGLGTLGAATLEKLSLDDMIEKSTAIVRGRVTGSSAALRGSMIHTELKVQVLERWKGSPKGIEDVTVPGGVMRGARQSFSGAPQLVEGTEYVLFLWTGKSGVAQVIGLSQGVFDIRNAATGRLATRAASPELMLAPGSGQAIKDEAFEISLTELGKRIRAVLAARSGAPK